MPSLVALAEELLIYAKQIEESLKCNDIAHTSFDTDTLDFLPREAQSTRLKLLNLSHDFRQLVRGARHSGLDVAYNWTDQVVLRIIWQYKIASVIPLHGSATYDEISVRCGLKKSIVIRTIRAAIPLNLFDERAPCQISHTAISKLLAMDDGYYNTVGLQLQDLGPASFRLIEAWEKFGEDMGEPHQCAFSLHNKGRSLFTVLAENPVQAHRFNSAMKYSIQDQDSDFHNVLAAFDWKSLDNPGARLVDVGGGHGKISQALARHTRYLNFVVQDLPHVVEQGRLSLSPEFQKRVVFQAHDFMEPQPSQTPPDAYLISRCLHNWSDYHAAKLLRALIPGLQKGSRIFIWDAILDNEPVKNLSAKFNLQQDFIMATIFNGKDRTVGEFEHILELGDPRFKVVKVQKSKECNLGMIEVRYD